MFTGIIENMAQVERREEKKQHVHFRFRFLNRDTKPREGESIAVDGTCLTVVKSHRDGFECDVVQETLRATTLAKLRRNDRVNIERSLRVGERLSGHFVTGHVDGSGRILNKMKQGDDYLFIIHIPPSLRRFIASKGSIAVDGISLTVQDLLPEGVKMAVIPHTYRVTTLQYKLEGSAVNLEVDMMARYAAAHFGETGRGRPFSLSVAELKRQGF